MEYYTLIKCPRVFQNTLGVFLSTMRCATFMVTFSTCKARRPEVVLIVPDGSLGASERTAE